MHGRGSPAAKRSTRRPVGYTYLHVAIDDYSRVAYVEAHDDETAKTLVGFWRRARIASVGLNPSDQEFCDRAGKPLRDDERRLATLDSLGLVCSRFGGWATADEPPSKRSSGLGKPTIP